MEPGLGIGDWGLARAKAREPVRSRTFTNLESRIQNPAAGGGR